MRKETRKYHFSVEGETEKWYFDWLQRMINSADESKYNVKLDSKVQKDPCAHVKGITLVGKTEIIHVFDRESEELVHTERFQRTLERMKRAESLGKKIKYRLGYSNFTFELWIILHKADCNGGKNRCKEYLSDLNKAYNERFESLDKYKEEKNFKQILEKLTIADVIAAVERAKAITERNEKNGYQLEKYKGYCFYKENPALSIGEIVGEILKECGIIREK